MIKKLQLVTCAVDLLHSGLVLEWMYSKMGLVELFVLIIFILESGAVPLESEGTAYEAEAGNEQYQTKTCLYDGTVYPKGSFKPSLCKECICSENGDIQCTDIECFIYPCVDKVHKPGDCCPMCPNGKYLKCLKCIDHFGVPAILLLWRKY